MATATAMAMATTAVEAVSFSFRINIINFIGCDKYANILDTQLGTVSRSTIGSSTKSSPGIGGKFIYLLIEPNDSSIRGKDANILVLLSDPSTRTST
jgi:hypothetical protein